MAHDHKKFTIFRGEDAPSLADSGAMSFEPFKDAIVPYVMKAQEEGVFKGEQARVLFAIPGFCLTHVWFKKGYPLPLHSHDADCLYYIIAGSLKLGSEILGPRDGFFVPADVPYGYTAGEDGVELLEFRHATAFNFVNHANGEPFWERAIETIKANQPDWESARMPVLNA